MISINHHGTAAPLQVHQPIVQPQAQPSPPPNAPPLPITPQPLTFQPTPQPANFLPTPAAPAPVLPVIPQIATFAPASLEQKARQPTPFQPAIINNQQQSKLIYV